MCLRALVRLAGICLCVFASEWVCTVQHVPVFMFVCVCECVQKCLHQKASFFCAAVAAELQTEMLLVIKKNQSEKRIFGNQPAEVPFFKQAAVE